MTRVAFDVSVHLSQPARTVWAALADWARHGDWIPATEIRILNGHGDVGTQFIARTGLGPLAFDDRMMVTDIDAEAMRAGVVKTGPWLTGTAGYAVVDQAPGCVVQWSEDVVLPGVPGFLAPIITGASRVAFRLALRRLAGQLGSRA